MVESLHWSAWYSLCLFLFTCFEFEFHRTLLRRYPDFTDPRAALAAAEWELGQIERAEGDWNRVDDPRYADREWLRQTRRWPARLCDALEAFLDVRSSGQAAPAVS